MRAKGWGIVSNPNAYFEPDGTLVFDNDGTVWDDLRIVPGQFDRPGVTDPTIRDWAVGTIVYKVWCFNQSQIGYFTVQVPHSYKTGSNIYVHTHWTPRDRGVAESGNTVAWKVGYSWASINGVFSDSQVADMTDTCDGVNDKHLMSPEVVIPGTGKGISSMLTCAFFRDTGDSWSGTGANGPALLEVDFHFEIDTVGSRERSSK